MEKSNQLEYRWRFEQIQVVLINEVDNAVDKVNYEKPHCWASATAYIWYFANNNRQLHD